jgi:hypothetical protein
VADNDNQPSIQSAILRRPEYDISAKKAIGGAFSAVSSRLRGLLPGGKKKGKRAAPDVDTLPAQQSLLSLEQDWRVRVSAPPGSPFGEFVETFKDQLDSDYANVLAPLKNTNGVVFPYTPSIQISHTANYNPLSPTHSNYQSYFYNNSQVSSISLTADFTAQTEDQARYVLAMVYFFRAATKMFYGQSNNRGNPPPVLYLDGYGSYYFPHVPVVVSNFSHTMPADVDYISCNLFSSKVISVTKLVDRQPVGLGLFEASAQIRGTSAAKTPRTEITEKQTLGYKQRVPTVSSITLELLPMYSRRNVSENFSWEKFSRGELLKGRGGFL